MRIEGVDHLVLTVRDVEATCAFYARVLGMEVVTFGGGRRALAAGGQKINLHQAGEEFSPHAALPTPGAGDLCLLSAEPLEAVIAHVQSCGVEILAGPIDRVGARGALRSIYLRDPDGNLIEVANERTQNKDKPSSSRG